MLLKISGAALLCIGGSLAGGMKANALSGRVLYLEGLYEGIMAFQNEINFKTAPLYEAFESAAKRDKSGIFKESLENFFEAGATRALEEAVKKSGLGQEEKEVMLSFSYGLSSPDKEGQIKNAALAMERINLLIKKATEKKDKLFSLYLSVGLLAGAAGGIMLF